MFHRVKNVKISYEYILIIQFYDGVTKLYNMKNLIDNNPIFNKLKDKEIFSNVEVDKGGYGIIWDDYTDISCNELYENGETVEE